MFAVLALIRMRYCLVLFFKTLFYFSLLSPIRYSGFLLQFRRPETFSLHCIAVLTLASTVLFQRQQQQQRQQACSAEKTHYEHDYITGPFNFLTRVQCDVIFVLTVHKLWKACKFLVFALALTRYLLVLVLGLIDDAIVIARQDGSL